MYNQIVIYGFVEEIELKYGRNVRQALVLITQFSIDMLVPIGLCSVFGWWLDQKFDTSWIFVLMFFIGALAGASNIYRSAKRIFSGASGDVRNRDQAHESDNEITK